MENPENLSDILRILSSHGVLNEGQVRFFEELFRRVDQDISENNKFENTKKFLSDSRGSGIFGSTGLLERFERIVEQVTAPRVEITVPAENNRTIYINPLTPHSVEFIAEIKNLEMERKGLLAAMSRGYKYQFIKLTDTGFMEKESVLAKGRTMDDTVAVDITVNNKNFGVGIHRIFFMLFDVFSKKEMSQRRLFSRYLVSNTIQITVLEAPTEQGQISYASMQELVMQIEPAQQSLQSLQDRLTALISKFPKLESSLIGIKELLKKDINKLYDLATTSMIYQSTPNEEILANMSGIIEYYTSDGIAENHSVFVDIKNELASGISFLEIAAKIMYNINTDLTEISSEIIRYEKMYSRRRLIRNIGLHTAIAGAAIGTGVGVTYLLKKDEISEEDLKKIKVKIIEPKDYTVVGIGNHLKNFSAEVHGQNKKLIEKINNGKIGKFSWIIDYGASIISIDDRQKAVKSKVPIPKPISKESSVNLKAVLWLIDGKTMEHQPYDSIKLNLVSIKITAQVEGNTLDGTVVLLGDTDIEFNITPTMENSSGQIFTWNVLQTLRANTERSYRLGLGVKDGKDHPPGDYTFWIKAIPKQDSNQDYIVSNKVPIKIV